MKRVLLSLILFFAITFQCFALQKRYFEISYEMPISVSNTTFYLVDILKEEFVIDLPGLSKTVPDSGFSINLFAQPAMSMTLDLRSFSIAINTGVDIQSTMSISKSFFKILYAGIDLNEEINISTAFNTDVFAFIDTTVGSTRGKLKYKIIPGIFFPVVHTEIGNSEIKIVNTPDAALVAKMNGGVNIYSQFNLNSLNDIAKISFANFDYLNFFSTFGFDLGGNFEYQLREGFSLVGYIRVPIIPGRLDNRLAADLNFSANLSFSNMLSGGEGFSYTYGLSNFKSEFGTKKIYRPLKFMLGINWDGFGKWFNVYADAGLGIRYPYTKAAIIYPEYILGMDLSLINIIGLSIRSQYCDYVFSNKVQVFLNTRVFEIDIGASIDSTSFVGAFKIAGLGVFVGMSVGF